MNQMTCIGRSDAHRVSAFYLRDLPIGLLTSVGFEERNYPSPIEFDPSEGLLFNKPVTQQRKDNYGGMFVWVTDQEMAAFPYNERPMVPTSGPTALYFPPGKTFFKEKKPAKVVTPSRNIFHYADDYSLKQRTHDSGFAAKASMDEQTAWETLLRQKVKASEEKRRQDDMVLCDIQWED